LAVRVFISAVPFWKGRTPHAKGKAYAVAQFLATIPGRGAKEHADLVSLGSQNAR